MTTRLDRSEPIAEDAPVTIPDRADAWTEQRTGARLHTMSVRQLVAHCARADRAVPDAVERAGPSIAALIEAAEPGFVAGGRLVYLGAGTSGRLGVLDASEAPPTFRVDPQRVVGLIAGGERALTRSSEGLEDDPAGAAEPLNELGVCASDTVIGIAAGGTTPWVLGGLEWAGQQASPPTLGLIVATPTTPPPGVAHVIVLETGPEVLAGSTRLKAGSATKMVLNTISTTLMVRAGRVYEDLMVDVRATNAKLLDRAGRIVAALTGLDRAEALALVERARGEVKLAVIMGRTGRDLAWCQRALDNANGRLDGVLAQLDTDHTKPTGPGRAEPS